MRKTCQGRSGHGLARGGVAAILLLGSWAMSGLGATATADSAQALAPETGRNDASDLRKRLVRAGVCTSLVRDQAAESGRPAR